MYVRNGRSHSTFYLHNALTIFFNLFQYIMGKSKRDWFRITSSRIWLAYFEMTPSVLVLTKHEMKTIWIELVRFTMTLFSNNETPNFTHNLQLSLNFQKSMIYALTFQCLLSIWHFQKKMFQKEWKMIFFIRLSNVEKPQINYSLNVSVSTLSPITLQFWRKWKFCNQFVIMIFFPLRALLYRV